MQNKPNWHRGRVSEVRDQRTHTRGPGVHVPNKPNLRAPYTRTRLSTSRETPYGVTTNDPAAPNEPNWAGSDFEDKCCTGKELRRMGHGSGRGKTKPIRR